jgi:hypothetical protein
MRNFKKQKARLKLWLISTRLHGANIPENGNLQLICPHAFSYDQIPLKFRPTGIALFCIYAHGYKTSKFETFLLICRLVISVH